MTTDTETTDTAYTAYTEEQRAAAKRCVEIVLGARDREQIPTGCELIADLICKEFGLDEEWWLWPSLSGQSLE